MCLGFAVLGTGIYVFTQVFSLIKKIEEVRTARDISRKILIVNSVHYHLQSDTFRYYFNPSEYNLSHVNDATANAENAWNDFLLVSKQNENNMYGEANNDIGLMTGVMDKFMAGNKDCLDAFAKEVQKDTSKTAASIISCTMELPQEELNNRVNSFSDRQIVFVDKKSKEITDGFNNVSIFMVFLMILYVALLIMIINWIRYLNRWL